MYRLHPVTQGNEQAQGKTEQHWLELFHRYLPRRYRATPARPYSIKSAAGAGPVAGRERVREREVEEA
jgi:hypothetical protein